MTMRPGGELATRPLHFIWIADCSGSMAVDGKIQSLNTAIKEAIPNMQQVADENPNAQVLVRAVRFSDGAQWHVSQPTDIADFRWDDLNAGGVTAMGRALTLVADQLKIPPMTDRALPPVLVLISDGQPTDDFTSGLAGTDGRAVGTQSRPHRDRNRRRRRSGGVEKVHRQPGAQTSPGQQPGGAHEIHPLGFDCRAQVSLFAGQPKR